MLVEYTAGLADALVAGAIDPSRLSIDRDTGDVRLLADAENSFALEPSVIDALTTAARELEREFGEPQDVEWVLGDDDKIWIVQSRPITARVIASQPAFLRGPAENASRGPTPTSTRTSWSDLAVVVLIAAPGIQQLFSESRARLWDLGESHSRDGAMFRQIIWRSRRAHGLQPDVNPFGVAASAVWKGAGSVVRHGSGRRRRR
jgi:hypothetical protein